MILIGRRAQYLRENRPQGVRPYLVTLDSGMQFVCGVHHAVE